MAISKLLDDLAIISKLGDNPGIDNNLSTAAFRAKFDEAALKIQKYINDVIVPSIRAINNPEDGLTMKGNITMAGNKVQGLAIPTADRDAATKQYVDTRKSTYKVTLLKTGWNDNVQTIAAADVTADHQKTDVFYAPGPAGDNYAACQKSNIRIVEQLDGAVKFQCDSVPQMDLIANVMVLKSGGAAQ